MRESPFVIVFTGPSGCGKTYVTEKILSFAKELRDEGFPFLPQRFPKYVTRPYRETEILDRRKGRPIDVEYVREIPPRCELVYRSYGKEYAVDLIQLQELLDRGVSPIVVVNDVRAVEELKRLLPDQVLSLFVFRDIIPDKEMHIRTGATRGGAHVKDSVTRFEKAVALYRVFIENIHVFHRVILNVDYSNLRHDGEPLLNLVHLQAENLLRGVLTETLPLQKPAERKPRLFIISGNAASGKDDIIKAANLMGRLQADIVKKYTTRPQEAGDEGEIVCKYRPKEELLQEFNREYHEEYARVGIEFTFHRFMNSAADECRRRYAEKDPAFKEDCTSDEYCRVRYETERLGKLFAVESGLERFWNRVKSEQESLAAPMIPGVTEVRVSKQAYLQVRGKFFELNPEYVDISRVREEASGGSINDRSSPGDQGNGSARLVRHKSGDFILYGNNDLYGEPIEYGFAVHLIREQWSRRQKHVVLTASLPEIFRLCREYFGTSNVVTAFTYSQISEDEHLRHADVVLGQAKIKGYQDILRYAQHIVDFDYALIYAETSLENRSGNQKDELVDQLFRLFRAYRA